MSTCRCKYQVFMIRHTHTHTPTHKQTHLPFVEQTLQKPIYCFIKVNISYRHIQIHDTHTLMYISHSLCEWCIWLLEILTFPAHPEGQIPTFQSLFGCPGTAELTGIWTPTGEHRKREEIKLATPQPHPLWSSPLLLHCVQYHQVPTDWWPEHACEWTQTCVMNTSPCQADTHERGECKREKTREIESEEK